MSVVRQIPQIFDVLKSDFIFYSALLVFRMNSIHTLTDISLRVVLIYYRLCQGLPSGFFPSGFPTRIMYVFILSACLERFINISKP